MIRKRICVISSHHHHELIYYRSNGIDETCKEKKDTNSFVSMEILKKKNHEAFSNSMRCIDSNKRLILDKKKNTS